MKTKGRTVFLECDAQDTPTQVIDKLVTMGAFGGSPPTYADAAPPKYADGLFHVVRKRFQELYIARLQRGPIRLDDRWPIFKQEVGPHEILCYVGVPDVNTAAIMDQTYVEVDDSIRYQPFYIQLEKEIKAGPLGLPLDRPLGLPIPTHDSLKPCGIKWKLCTRTMAPS